MAYEADRVIVELVAKTDQMDGPVKQSAATFDQSMGKIEASASRAEKAHGRLTMATNNNRIAMLEFQHVARGASDQIAAGAPLTQVLTQHMGQLSQAVSFAGGSFGKLGTFLGGPWGIALTFATVILAKLTLGHKAESDSVDSLVDKLKEHAEKTRNSEEADRIWSRTLDGLIERQHKLNEELGKRLQVQSAVDKSDLVQAQRDLGKLQKELTDERDKQADLQRQLASAVRDPSLGTNVGGPAEARVQQLKNALATSKEQVSALERAITDAQQRITKSQIVVGEAQGQAMADLTAKAKTWGEAQLNILRSIEQMQGGKLAPNTARLTASYTELQKAIDDAAAAGLNFDATTRQSDKLNNQLRDGKISVRTYTTEVSKLAVALEAAAEAAKEAKKGTGEFGAQVSFAEARKIAEGAGLTVTSAQRSTKRQTELYNDPSVNRPGNPVAKPGTSAHEGVRGRWALDIAFAPGLTAGKVKKVFGDQGVALSLVKKEAGHFHIEGSTSQADSEQRAAAEAAAKEARDEQAYQNAKADLEAAILEARKELGLSAQQVADFETLAVKASHDKYADQVKYQEDAGRLSKAEADTLLKINDEREKLRLELVARRLREAQFAQQEENFARGRDFQAASYETEAELLQAQEGLARTVGERRQIEQRLIDLQFQEERLKNQYIIDWAERVKANKDATEKEKADAALAEQIAQMHQGTIDQRHADATTANDRNNASPLQDFFQSIPQTADEIDQALEGIAAHGLATFNDALASAIVNFTSLRDVARTVLSAIATDLIKLALQQIELHTIGAALGAASVASTTATAAAVGAAWAGPAALAALATLGTNAGPAAAAIASTVGLATILGAPKAGGGRIFGPGSDTSDSILTPLSRDEFVIRAGAARRVGFDTLEHINSTGELPRRISPSNASAAAPGSRNGSNDMAQLRSMLNDAIRAMPGISLYPTLHPADALRAALGTRDGQRAMFDFFGSNSTAIKTNLNRPGG